ncbi:hypothetical protein ACE01N_20650, partial [Saccharicrinis sp. FJH2]|uniref:hypothetical protein n=1 Tax=Saccharicrinis sp. FJH65 TaxID=3344659 RepID=UPI0035F32E57
LGASVKNIIMKLTKSQIKEMAQNLEVGMNIFINREDLEIRTIFDLDEIIGDTEFWEEELEKLKKNGLTI